MIFAFIQSIFIYLGFAWVFYNLSSKYVVNGKWKYVILPILVYCAVFGARYQVGADFTPYSYFYEQCQSSNIPYTVEKWEAVFKWFTITFANLHLPLWIYFAVICFSQLYLVVYTFKDHRNLLPYMLMVFMVGCYWLGHATLLRQYIAVAIFTFSLTYLIKGAWFKHYCCIIVSFFVHKSVLILLPVYLIYKYKKEWYKNIKYQLCILLVSLILMNLSILQNFLQKSEGIIRLLGYQGYIDEFGVDEMVAEKTIGIGFIVKLAINIIIIITSNKTKSYVNSPLYTLCYDFYFTSVIFRHVFLNSAFLQRINCYFDSFSLVVAAATLFYFSKYNKKMYYNLLMLYFLMFVAFMYKAIDNSALFIFQWQTDLYYLKNNLM